MTRRKLDVSFGAKRVKPEEELESGLPRELRNRPKRRERRLAVKPSLLDYIRTGSEVAQGLRPENIPMTGMRAGQQIIPAIGGGLSALYDYARSTAPGQVVTDVLGAPTRFGEKVRENPAILADLIPGAGTVQGIREGAQRLAEGDPEAMRNAAAMAALAGAMDVIPGGGKGANLAVKGAKELAEEGVDLAARGAPAIVKNISGSYKRAVEGAGYDVGAIAERYPEIAPPTLAIDPKTGKEFLQKTISPEAESVAAARKRAQTAMEKEGYTPYFDPSQRFYVNPAPYNLQGNTLVDVVPKREATIAKYAEMANNPEATARLTSAYERGLEHPSAKDWYAMGQLEDQYIQQYGPELGRQMFKLRFADAMAATTGGADPTSNLLMANYANYLKEAGLPTPSAAYEMPYPIGGRYATGNISMYDKLLNQGAGLTTLNPKRFNFSANFLGDINRSTIDEQMSDLFVPGMAIPPGESYGIFEKALGDLARRYDVMPAQFQDVAWAGGKLAKTPRYKPQPMIQTVNEAIERTARITGQDPEEVVLNALIQAKRPLYAKGGLATVDQ